MNRFTICVDVKDGWLLYNTVTGSIITVDNENDLHESFDELKKMSFYVPIDFDEKEWVDKIRLKKKSRLKDRKLRGFTILTTTNCNARCYYCYEKGLPGISMAEKTAVDVANYIIDNSGDNVDIGWFGGEPLVNAKVIDIIIDTLSARGKKFKTKMISNGLLFSDSIIEKAKNKWKLKRVQITLDGTRDVYQKAKAYKYAVGNEFERVIDNIVKLTEANISVSIRLNQCCDNTNNLLELVDYLSVKFRGNKLVSAYNNWLFGEQIDVEMFRMLQNRIIENGLFRRKALERSISCFHCMADNDTSIVIAPNGDIGKCEHYANRHLIGSVYDSDYNKDEIVKWKETYKPTEKCFDCPLYPQCVRIKMCPNDKENCSYVLCENKIELIKQTLVKKYKSFKSSDAAK